MQSQEDEASLNFFFSFSVGELDAAFIINLTPQPKTKGRKGGRKEKVIWKEQSCLGDPEPPPLRRAASQCSSLQLLAA